MMKKVLVVAGLILGVSAMVVVIGLLLYSQIQYVDLVDKRISISEDESEILIFDEREEVVFSYTLEEWRNSAERKWDSYFDEPLVVDETEITPQSFIGFSGVSPFPGGTKKLGFVVSTQEGEGEVSLFWMMDISKKEIEMIGEENVGSVGNITWSPKESYFAYYLNTMQAPGEYLTVDNAHTLEKEFVISGEDILEALESEGDDFDPEFREMEWSEDGNRLFFKTNIPEEEEGDETWSIMVNGNDLQKEEDEEEN